MALTKKYKQPSTIRIEKLMFTLGGYEFTHCEF